MRWGRIVVISLAASIAAYLQFGGSTGGRGPVDADGAVSGGPLIKQVKREVVLKMLAEGRKIIFVDAREGAEFEEEHIPGAINLTLREVENVDPGIFEGSDVVIAYCLKDFRGFEVARALKRAGVARVRTLEIVGLNGWKRSGLPTAGKNSLDEGSALSMLKRVARAASGNPEGVTR